MIPPPPVDPACLNQTPLFASLNPLDHIKAREICATCPVFDWCEKWTAESIAMTTNMGCHIEGTWAGQLHGGTPTALRIIEEDQRYTDDEARACHAAYVKGGQRSPYIDAGERTYQRRLRPTSTQRRKAAA